jgi:hypothetical protein
LVLCKYPQSDQAKEHLKFANYNLPKSENPMSPSAATDALHPKESTLTNQ